MGRRKNKGRAGRRKRYDGEAVLELVDRQAQKAGRAIRFLPLTHWEAGALFLGAKDSQLARYSGGRFGGSPASDKATHPLFVLEKVANLAHKVCPCSTRAYSNRRYIEKGCVLRHTSYVVAWRTYLVEHCCFQVPQDKSFLWSLRFWGLVPAQCLHEVE